MCYSSSYSKWKHYKITSSMSEQLQSQHDVQSRVYRAIKGKCEIIAAAYQSFYKKFDKNNCVKHDDIALTNDIHFLYVLSYALISFCN